MLPLMLSCVGAIVTINVVEADAERRSLELAHALGDLIEERYDHQVRAGTAIGDCTDETSCARELALRDGAEIVLLLRVYQTPHFLLLAVTRTRADGRAVLAASRRFREDAPLDAELTPLVRELFGDQAPPLQTAELPPPVVESRPPWIWIGTGVSAGLGAIGLGFSLSSLAARRELAGGVEGYDRVGSLTSRMEDHALAGNIFFVSALLTFGTAVLLEVLE